LVEKLHQCTAELRESLAVTECFEGQMVWKGLIRVYDLEGHPEASTCYAWTEPTEGGERVFAVLAIPPVTTPEEAVRASIVADAQDR
jgi:hypothetical protein